MRVAYKTNRLGMRSPPDGERMDMREVKMAAHSVESCLPYRFGDKCDDRVDGLGHG